MTVNLHNFHFENESSYRDAEFKRILTEEIQRLNSIDFRKAENRYEGRVVVPLTKIFVDEKTGKKSKPYVYQISTPFRYLPNVSHIKVDLNGDNELANLFGFTKKNPPNISIKPYKLKPFNRYIYWNLCRLVKSFDNPNKYWTIVRILMQKSHVFRVMSFQRVIKKWHRDYPMSSILYYNRKMSDIINNKLNSLEFRRVYIQKADGKTYRPLGVPKEYWRMHLHNLNNFLWLFIKDYIPQAQHGFQPRKGTKSAWEDIANKEVFSYKYIYEFDLKNFFGNVLVNKISERLRKLRVPKLVVQHLEDVNLSIPRLPPEELLDEQLIHKKIEFYDKMQSRFSSTSHYQDNTMEIFSMFSSNQQEVLYRGVAQGAPTSPLLSILLLNHFMRQHSQYQCLMYADDGIFFSDHPIKIKDFPELGIILNQDKSGYIKKDGVWIKPIKFLGLEFNGPLLQLHSRTRKGANISPSKMINLYMKCYDYAQEQSDSMRAAEKEAAKDICSPYISSTPDIKSSMSRDKLTEQSWDKLLKSRLNGLLLSRMYQGSFNSIEVSQCFDLTFKPKSYLAYVKPKINDVNFTVFNSSTFSCHSLCEVFRRNQAWYRFTHHPRVIPYLKDKVYVERIFRKFFYGSKNLTATVELNFPLKAEPVNKPKVPSSLTLRYADLLNL